MSKPLQIALVTALLLGGCEPYDPPPQADLEIPEDGVWYGETPLRLLFDQPISPESLVVSIWSRDLDKEGDLTSEAEGVAQGCSVAGEEGCGEVTVEVSEDKREALVHQGSAFTGREGRPHILVVHKGLANASGRERQVDDWFDFQITPNCQGGNPIDIGLQSSMMLLISDLSHLVPGVYLRIYFEMLVDPDNGQTWLVGTLADILPGESPNATAPEELQPKLDPTGWVISLDGWMDRTPDGELCLRTVTKDLSVQVLGLFEVILGGFRIEATFKAGTGGAPDTMAGYLTSSHGEWGVSDGGSDLNDLGLVGASAVATGVDPSTMDPLLGKPCDEDPCAPMTEADGLCYLPDPWVVPEICP